MLQNKYELDGLPIAIAGGSRLLVDLIILVGYARRRKEIGSFNLLLEVVIPRKTEEGSQKISYYEEL